MCACYFRSLADLGFLAEGILSDPGPTLCPHATEPSEDMPGNGKRQPGIQLVAFWVFPVFAQQDCLS
jgi:hypothetical protein